MNNRLSIKENKNELTLSIKLRTPFFVKVMLSLILGITILVILTLLYWVLVDSDFEVLSGLIAIGVFTFIGQYFLQLLLWNTYGKEVIHLQKSHYQYFNDYKFFKNNFRENDFEKIHVGYVIFHTGKKANEFAEIIDDEMASKKMDLEVLNFYFDETSLTSEVQLPESDLIEAVNRVRKFIDLKNET